MRKLVLLFVILQLTVVSIAQHSFQKSFPVIDQYVDSLMKDWNIPGLALGIVYKDQLIYAKGYGYRDLEKKLPVGTKTLFPIASNTKLFTSTLAAMLADKGKLNLDVPVRTYLPGLNFSNEELNAKVSLRDMLSHRTGLPRYDFIWAGNDINRNEVASKVVFMKPVIGFREGFVYNNVIYAAAGSVMEYIMGKSWETLMNEMILKPLEMRSMFSMEELTRSPDHSLSYFEKDSTRQLLPKKFFAQSEALGPAGSMISSVEDMSHWMIAQLNGGMFKGKQVISKKAINETMIPNTMSERISRFDELSNALYAMGRTIQTYKGYKITSHTGSIDGYYSNLLFLPSENIGVFMIHNSIPAGNLRYVMNLPVIDHLLGLSYTAWSQRYLKDYLVEKQTEKRIEDSLKVLQVKSTTPSHTLQSYTGTFTHEIFGDIKIEMMNNNLWFSFRKIRMPLHHYHYDQFITKPGPTDLPQFRLSFLTGDKGDIVKILIRLGGMEEQFIKN